MTLWTVMYKVGCEADDDVDGDDVKDDVNNQDVSISLSSYFHGS